MVLSERKKKILAAVVDEYVRTAEPVGSKAIAQTAGLGCSSATIRNELAELVSLGYLEQPHTSAGRVPTPMGYRMYVNELMQKQKLSLEETEDINRRMNQKLRELDDTIDNVSRLASQLTDYPALALTTRSAVTIKRFDIIYVDANTFILVVMLSDNTVKNKLVHLPVSVDQRLVQRLSALFNSGFTGITDEQITPLLINATERAADDTALGGRNADGLHQRREPASQPARVPGPRQGPPPDGLSLRRRLSAAPGPDARRRGGDPGPHRPGERGRGAEGFQRRHRDL